MKAKRHQARKWRRARNRAAGTALLGVAALEGIRVPPDKWDYQQISQYLRFRIDLTTLRKVAATAWAEFDKHNPMPSSIKRSK